MLLFAVTVITVLLCVFFAGCRTETGEQNNASASSGSYISDESVMSSGTSASADMSYVTCIYDAAEYTTEVCFAMSLANDTIYKATGAEAFFSLAETSGTTDAYACSVDISLAAGRTQSVACSFAYPGEIASVTFTGVSMHYATLFASYAAWFVSAIAAFAVLAGVVAAYVICLNSKGRYMMPQNGVIWVAACALLATLAVFIYLYATSVMWVPALIVLCAAAALCPVIAGLYMYAHIRSYMKYRHSDDDDDDYDYDTIELMDEILPDCERMERFTVSELQEYCQAKHLHGYSSMSKKDLIQFIAEDYRKGEEEAKKSYIYKSDKKITFADVVGMEEVKETFREKVIYASQHKDLYESFHKKTGGGILLYGLPGTGKTMFAEACASECDAAFMPIKSSDIKDKWYGESEQKVADIFAEARKVKRAVIFFDEFDTIGTARDSEYKPNDELMAQILTEMQGINHDKDCQITVIAATNRPWLIDTAFMRPGRFDEKIYVPLPDLAARRQMFLLKLSGIPQKNIDYDKLAQMTEGYNGADITHFCDKLKMNAIARSMSSGGVCPITMEDVLSVSLHVTSSVYEQDLADMTEFNAQAA